MTSASERRHGSGGRRPERRWAALALAAAGCAALAGGARPSRAAPSAAAGGDRAAASAAPADGEEGRRSAARELAREGLALLNEERYADAEDRLRRAFELVPAATVAVLRARALERLDRLVEATESYETAVRLGREPAAPPAFKDAAREAEAELLRLRPEVPRLTITLAGAASDDPALAVELDGEPVPPALLNVARPVDPGQHLVLASYAETVHDTRYVTVSRGGAVKVLMRIDAVVGAASVAAPPPAPAEPGAAAPSRQRQLGWVTTGVGGVGLGVGVVSGLRMLAYQGELDDGCRPHCPAELDDELAGFRATRTVSAVGYGVGMLAVGLGAGMILTAPPRRPRAPPAVAVVVGDGIYLRGELR